MSMTHYSDDTLAFRSLRIAGSATLTIVASIDTMSRLMQQVARIAIFLRGVSSTEVVVDIQRL